MRLHTRRTAAMGGERALLVAAVRPASRTGAPPPPATLPRGSAEPPGAAGCSGRRRTALRAARLLEQRCLDLLQAAPLGLGHEQLDEDEGDHSDHGVADEHRPQTPAVQELREGL